MKALTLALLVASTTLASHDLMAQTECPPYHIFSGETDGDLFGISVASVGDVNADGYADIIVGAMYNDAGGANSGRAYVFSGLNGDTLYVFTGEAAEDMFGYSVASAGDVNADGIADIIVGAYLNDAKDLNAGKVYVFSGLNGDTLHIFSGEAFEDGFGFSVASAGDVNSDGYADLIIGAIGNDVGGLNAGRAYVFSGFNGDTLHIFTGELPDDNFGRSVASAGDVNNDSYTDLIVGATQHDGGLLERSRAYVFSGQNGDTLHVFIGKAMVSNFGVSVATAGDVNNDAYADVIVGAYLNNPGINNEGRAYVFSGKNGDILYTFTGELGGDLFGQPVASAGDVNSDGYADVIIGASANRAGGLNAGRAYVFSGIDGDTLFVFTGNTTDERFGYSVASANDVNADGYSDLIVGAFGVSSDGSSAGRAYVYLGGQCGDADSDGIINHDDLMILVEYYFQFGDSPVPCNSGDVNSDGSTDLADIVYLAQYLNSNGPAPCAGGEPPPFIDWKKKPERFGVGAE